MGILTTVLTRVGLPIAVLVIGGLVLSRFKDPILGAITAGAQTVGGAITQPIAGLFQGIGQGISNIPQLPEFPDIFGNIFGGFQKGFDNFFAPDVSQPFSGFDPNEPKIVSPCKCGSVFDFNSREERCLPCDPVPASVVEGAERTADDPPVFKIQLSKTDPVQFLTFDQINDLFGFAVNDPVVSIIDFKSTDFRERVPVTHRAASTFFDNQGDAIFFLGNVSPFAKIGQGLALDPNLQSV